MKSIEVTAVELDRDGHVEPERQALRLTIAWWERRPESLFHVKESKDSRDESWETLVDGNDWGAFRDVIGFDPDDPEIQRAVDEAVAQLQVRRDKSAADKLVAK